MAQTNVNIRMDAELKKQFESFCNEVGLTMTAAFSLFAKTTVREQRIPFEISLSRDPFYSESNMALLKRRASEMDAGKKTAHDIIEADDDDTLA